MTDAEKTAFILQSAQGWKNGTIRPYGQQLLAEDDFAEITGAPFAGTPKWGILVTGAGTLAQDTGVKWSGAGSVKLTTGAAATNGVEIKTQIQEVFEQGDLASFEILWCENFVQGTTKFQFGLEARGHTDIKQARFQYTVSSGKWQMEDGVADAYVDLNPVASIERPRLNSAAGTPLSWARVVIDPFNKTYYTFEAPYSDGAKSYIKVWDLHTHPLVVNGASGTPGDIILAFVYGITASANAETAYSTNWRIGKIPKCMRNAYDSVMFGY